MADTVLTAQNDTEAGEDKSQDAPAPETAATDDKPAAKEPGTDESKDQAADKQDADGDKGDDKEPDGAPEEYEPFTLPDGVEVDEAAAEQFKELARDLNLTQEQAQKLVDLQASRVQAQAEAWDKQLSDWADGARADKEFGGDKFDENIAVAKKALDKFGTPELRETLDAGYGNHPEVIRLLYRVGKAISDDGFVAGGTSGQADKLAKLYPSMQKTSD